MKTKSDKVDEGFNYNVIINAKGKYKYNFKALEYKLQKSYDNFIIDFTDSEYFQQFYKDLFLITYGILETTEVWARADFKNEDVAQDYSTYLIERILEGKWRARVNPNEDKFGWVPYIRLNIREIIYTKYNKVGSDGKFLSLDEIRDLIKEHNVDAEDEKPLKEYHPALVDHESSILTEIVANNTNLAKKCSNFLKLMYGDKYYILCSKLMALKNETEIEDEELRQFLRLSVSLFKRLYEQYNLNKVNTHRVDKVFNSSLYLASILSSDKDKRLYVSLDLANLYRLALAFGGEEIRVPTIEDLDELVSTARVSYEILSSDLNSAMKIDKLRNKVRKDFDVFVRFDKLSQNVRNVFRYISTEIADPVVEDNPLVSSLVSLSSRSDEIIDKILGRMETMLECVDSPEELINVYKEMSNNLQLSLNMITNIKNLFESRFKKGEGL